MTNAERIKKLEERVEQLERDRFIVVNPVVITQPNPQPTYPYTPWVTTCETQTYIT